MTKLMDFEFVEQTYRETLVAAFPYRLPLKLVVDNPHKNNRKKQLRKVQKESLRNWRNKW